jgi:PIN domain nuclease of toxin-antitoxin system
LTAFLLDTHILLWSSFAPHKLSTGLHSALADSSHSRFLSPVSIWETIVLLEKKKIVIERDFGEWFEETRSDLDLQEVPLDWKIVHEMRLIMLGHKDPADRFLAATAKAYDLTLVTADAQLLKVPGLKTLSNL